MLTLIGQSKDIGRATGHIQKIFIGISGLQVSRDNHITALKSPDGEQLELDEFKVNIENRAFTDWIKSVEKAMKEALKAKITTTLDKISKFSMDDEKFYEVLSSSALQPYILAVLV